MKKKILLFILIMVLVYAIGGIIFIKSNTKEKATNVVKDVEKIDKYNYKLKSNSTELYKKEFKILKQNLEKDPNYEEYAKSVAKLFVIDLFSISAKVNKYDVGGIDFIYPNNLENYKLNVEDTIYKYVEDNSNGKRKQELPIVNEITVNEIKEDKFSIEKEDYPAYKVNLSWKYEKDMGYDKKAEVIMIKDNDIIYVVEYNPQKKEA